MSDVKASKRPINLSLSRDLVARARAERLNLSAIAEQAIARAVAESARKRFMADVAEGVRQHEEYLMEYGSLAEAVWAHEHDEPFERDAG